MSNPYIGELRLFGGNFAPQGWARCDGTVLAIAEYDALFSLIGTTYGGDGQSTFALPDLRGRMSVHTGAGPNGTVVIGQAAGVPQVTVTTSQLPAHSHLVAATSELASTDNPAGAVPAGGGSYAPAGSTPVNLAPAAVGANGGGQPTSIMPPYLVLNWIISLYGIYPSQS